ncbi:unnamed protein product, partial [Pelagomonas calceolata]
PTQYISRGAHRLLAGLRARRYVIDSLLSCAVTRNPGSRRHSAHRTPTNRWVPDLAAGPVCLIKVNHWRLRASRELAGSYVDSGRLDAAEGDERSRGRPGAARRGVVLVGGAAACRRDAALRWAAARAAGARRLRAARERHAPYRR